MVKQNGFLKVEGTLGDISFYKSKDRFLIRTKEGVSKERIMSEPVFKRTRENGTEFGMIATASKLLRDNNAVLIRKAYDGRLNVRLMQLLSKVKQSGYEFASWGKANLCWISDSSRQGAASRI